MTTSSTKPTQDSASAKFIKATVSGIRSDIGKQLNDPTPVYVVLGASDVIAERARVVAATAARQGAELAERARAWNASASVDAADVPRLAVSRALKVASQVEAVYGDLAIRGREVAGKVREGGVGAGADMVRRAVVTLSRSRTESTFPPATGAVVVGEAVIVGDPPAAGRTTTEAAVEDLVEGPAVQPSANGRVTKPAAKSAGKSGKASKAGTAEAADPSPSGADGGSSAAPVED